MYVTTYDPFPPLRMGGVVIESVENFNYLDIRIDKKLKMNLHLNNCFKRAYSKLFMLGKIRQYIYMYSKTALNLFKCMVLPYIEYGNCF